jgi:thiol-disulfide isomerase/thioredoxin
MQRWCLTVLVAVALTAAPAAGRAAAPALPLTLADGRGAPVALAPGAPTAVLFWASWCRPCRPLVVALGRANVPGVRIVLVNELVSETASDTVVREVARLHLRNAVLYDRFGQAGDRLDVRGLPTLCLLDAQGRLVRSEMGAMPPARALDLVRALATTGADRPAA